MRHDAGWDIEIHGAQRQHSMFGLWCKWASTHPYDRIETTDDQLHTGLRRRNIQRPRLWRRSHGGKTASR